MLLILGLFFLPNVLGMFIGTATSSYQIEGHTPGISIWDTFTQSRNLEPVGNATNHYLLYKDDVKLMYDLNFRNYRFSISWTRIMPYKFNETDPAGIKFYHDLLDELHKYNITPYVTLYHWDLPEYLSPGWTNPQIVDQFLTYSKLMFKEYDSKVKYWITINEPLTTSLQGYDSGSFAPGIHNAKYTSGHYQLLAHAYAADFYKKNYKGKIGIAINSNWFEPKDSNSITSARAEVMKSLGWFTDPLFFGKYPQEIAYETPSFTPEEQQMLMNSLDFFGLNHYTTYLVDSWGGISIDQSWTKAKSSWLFSVPWGMYKILHFMNDRYGSKIPIYITECGFSVMNDNYNDIDRINYISGYLNYAEQCEGEGINVKGFFIWSFLDNFEWASGYRETFGIVAVNRTGNYERMPKSSAYYVQSLITN